MWQKPDSRGHLGLVIVIGVAVMASLFLIEYEAQQAFTRNLSKESLLGLAETVLLYCGFTWMLLNVLLHAVSELGAILRQKQVGIAEDPADFYRGGERSPLLVLVPAYKEERETIWQTMMSAALSEHPDRKVVLLIDDPPDVSGDGHARRLLLDARRLPILMQAHFDAAAKTFAFEYCEFQNRERGRLCATQEIDRLRHLYGLAAAWLESEAASFLGRRAGDVTHTDQLFAEKILLEPARHHRDRVQRLAVICSAPETIRAEYVRLNSLFRVQFDSFERKKFANLSHAPNKAMNLNSYLSLLGGAFRETVDSRGPVLVRCPLAQANLVVPHYKYVVVIDADSLITWNYNLHLISVLEQPENARVAIAQSPYTAIPAPPSAIERAAAASTDAQFFSHQGLAYFGCSSWVGASAVIRSEALQDIRTLQVRDGREVAVYIKDDIQIEDAAATMDLLEEDWFIYHDAARLSYSATPPDFGALIIQRRRWANGGLLILPRLLGLLLKARAGKNLKDVIFRLPNLASAATNGVFFLILLLVPFDDDVVPPWLSVVMLPALALNGICVVKAGYRWFDLFAVQALSVLLISVNLAGTVQSLRQAVSGQQIPFARTPKTAGRTQTPRLYLFASVGIFLYALSGSMIDAWMHRYAHAAFGALNACILAYCIAVFIGIKPAWDDLRAQISMPRVRMRVRDFNAPAE